MRKKILFTILYLISIFCVVYYTIKYYCEKSLMFGEKQLFIWTVIIVIIMFCLVIGIVNYLKLNVVKEQNQELLMQASHLSKKIEEYHYSEMNNINSTMECILDLDKGDESDE